MFDFLSQITGQPYDLKRSVTLHVQNLMNTRQGSLRHMPEYGLPEFSPHHSCPQEKKAYMAAIKNLIERFEPRITCLEIEEVMPQAAACIMQLRFKALLSGGDPLNLEAMLLSGGTMMCEEMP